MSSTAYRNAHGVELKPGNWFLGADQYGQKEGIIDRVVQRGGIADTNGGPSVVYKSAPGERAVQTILADNVFQTLGPMVIEGDGTVKQNPKERYPFTIHWGSSASLARMSSVGLTLAKSIHEAQALMREGARHVEVTEWHNGLGETIWKNGDFISPRKNPLTRVKVKSAALAQYRTVKQNPIGGAEAVELYWFILNSVDLGHFFDRLGYDPRAVSDWAAIAKTGAQMYATEHAERSQWDSIFPAAVRKETARLLFDRYISDAHPIRANPLTRVKVKSPAQRGGAAPDERLTKRRKATQKAPPGFYANPTPRLKSPTQKSQRPHLNQKTGKMTTRPSKRLQTRRALTHNLNQSGVWANPAPPMKYGFDLYDADRGTYTVHDKRKGKFFETARFTDFAKAKEYAQAYADANNCQVKITGNLSHPTIKRK